MRAAGMICLMFWTSLASAQSQNTAVPERPSPSRTPAPNLVDIEPAVDVSTLQLRRDVGSDKGVAPSKEPASAAVSPNDRRHVNAPTPRAAAKAGEGGAPPRGAAHVMDTLDLGTTSITGNQELPKVLYIVPWKKSDLGDLVGRPVNTLLDEVLEPVDPEVFHRQLEYYQTLHGDSGKE